MYDGNPAHRIGACSWSLQAAGPDELVEKLRAVGVPAIQLALEPLRSGSWPVEATLAKLRGARIALRSTMMSMAGEDYATLDSIRRTGGVRPTQHWNANLAAARENAQIARRLGTRLVTFHAGFLPHDRKDPERALLLERLRTLVDVFGAEEVEVGFETGQESAETLFDVLADLQRPRAGVNFDPANMILYGMGDPVAAVRALAPRVKQIHVKDARRTRAPGTWGEEVCVGTGEVDWHAFFAAAREGGVEVDFMIEREAGEDRVGDMRRARKLVEHHLGVQEAVW